VRLVENGALRPEPWFSLAERIRDPRRQEEGLVGMALPPPGAPQDRVFLAYIDRAAHLTLSRFELDPESGAPEPASETPLLQLPKPDPPRHHCGHLAFGPDGFLYLCLGDFAPGPNRAGRAQDPGHLEGSILRLDVLGTTGTYTVPADNPLTEVQGARAEVWAYGLRNPWRFAIDPASGDLFIPDVGANDFEELNLLPRDAAGVNFGWPLAEGFRCRRQARELCRAAPIRWPALVYPRGELGCAVIGGAVLREAGWEGVMVFADHCTGDLWAVRNLAAAPELRRLGNAGAGVAALDAGPGGDILAVNRMDGRLLALQLPAVDDRQWLPAASHGMLLPPAR
jgi:glucose/arabinose dehydrogenase